MKVISSSYVGNGASTQTITIGVAPSIIFNQHYFKTLSHPTTESSRFASDSPNLTTAFTALSSTGFTVGSTLNVNGTTYYFTAIVDNGGSDFAYGSYTGNGVNNRAITGTGFTPAVVVIKGNSSHYGWWRTTEVTGDSTLAYPNFGNQSGRIKSFTSDGFTLGTDIEANENGITFYYFALKGVAGLVKTGSYTGDGTDSRNITGLGFDPVLVWIKGNNSTSAVFRNLAFSGDNAFTFGSSTLTANLIQSFSTGGGNSFQIGSSTTVNQTSITHYYLALGTGFTRTQKTLSMKMSVQNTVHHLSMRVSCKRTLHKTISMKVRVTNPKLRGRLRNLAIRSIDNQKFTKDVLKNQPSDSLYTNLVAINARENLNLNYISTVALIDPVSMYPAGFVPKQGSTPRSAAAFNQVVCDAIHNGGLGVIHRMTSMAMEGAANFPEWPSVTTLPIGHKTDIIPVVVTDNFDRTIIGTDYVTNTVGGGVWGVSNGKLVLLNSGNEFTYNIAHTTATYADGEFEGTVEKSTFGQDGIIICGGTMGNSPYFFGYGIYMQDSNKLIVEDIGQRNISADTRVILHTDTSLTLVNGHYYKIKAIKTGSSIAVKIWDETAAETEPASPLFTVISTTYSSGWFGFTTAGFGKVVHFDNLKITPSQNLNSFMGMVYTWMINNPTSFKDNDIIAPFPEFDTCQGSPNMCYFVASRSWLHADYNTTIPVTFFNELKEIEDYAASQIGVRLKTGYTGPNFTSVASPDDPGKALPNGTNDLDKTDKLGLTMMKKAGIVSTDFYGTTYVSTYNPTGAQHPAQEIYDWVHAVSQKHKLPVFFQEWGGYSPTGSGHVFSATDVSSHDLYFRGIFNKMADLNDNVIDWRGHREFEGLNYYGFQDTGDADTGMLRNSGTNYSTATLRVKGQVLRDFYQMGTPSQRTIQMRVRNKITPTHKTLSMKVKTVALSNTGRLKTLRTRSVSTMKWTKDTTKAQPSDLTIFNVVEFAYRSMNLTHIDVTFPIDPVSFYPTGYTPAPRSIVGVYQKWVDEIHKRGLGVLHRPVCFAMEGREGFDWKVGSNIYPQGTAAQVLDGTDRNNWLGIVYNFIINNPSLFNNGDWWAPFPERTEGLFDTPAGVHSFLSTSPSIQTNFVNFFVDLKTVSDAAFAAIGKAGVKTGATSDNYSEVRSLWIPQALYNNSHLVPFDYYQNYNNDGYGKAALSDDLDAIYFSRGNNKLFWQEWGTTPEIIIATNSARNNPDGSEGSIAPGGVFHPISYYGLTAHPENRDQLILDIFTTIAEKHEQGKLDDFNYWGFWDTGINDSGLIKISGSSTDIANFSLRPEGVTLADWYENGVARPPFSPPVVDTTPQPPLTSAGWTKKTPKSVTWTKK